ncbi:hypothetical protein B0T18DRAFT_96564 [Schizothecium vesticola]|uniref:Uncharacterized protein n=1 Tax=Schizothecium vesticola TaxID=314040 RepID=A0AA40K7P5_9PEZI|nr:hypothetical protein B0T18DRAFT_96564 [Schizothecium vesticola]
MKRILGRAACVLWVRPNLPSHRTSIRSDRGQPAILVMQRRRCAPPFQTRRVGAPPFTSRPRRMIPWSSVHAPPETGSCSPGTRPGRRRRRIALAATTYVDPRNGNQGKGQTTPAGTSKQLLAERPLCFYFCGEARGRRLSLIGVPLRFPFPEGSRPLGTREA